MREIKVWDGFNKRHVSSKVDDFVFDSVAERGWNLSERGYAYCKMGSRGRQSSVYLHMLVLSMNGIDVFGKMGDHINGDKLDNRIDNLRVATAGQNQHNRKMNKRNISGYYGVSFDVSRGKWKAQGCINYKAVCIGRFGTAEDAAIARDKWAMENFGEFAALNFPERWQ